jgi:hypothetical protein
MTEDWSTAEALARDYLVHERGVSEEISFRRFEPTPFLLGAWWNGGGGARVLVYNRKVQTARGIAALPPYLSFLGEERVRTLSIEFLDTLLYTFGVSAPERPDVGAPWRRTSHYPDLFPVIADRDGVLAYVVHYVEVHPPGPFGGSKPLDWPLVLQRWSLQLHPVRPGLDWQLEERVERPRPPITTF